MNTIRIPQHIIDAICRQAHDELPNEACGLLTGRGDTVMRRYALTNVDRSPEHFSFDPREQFRVLHSARSDNQRILANYHSHPASPARPSGEDLRLAFDPEAVYIIVSLMQPAPDVKAFSVAGGTAQPVAIEIIENPNGDEA
ncbi:MAG: M67 family metallopeptidase [Tannerella sp.]|jgi:proteasome lid subunit RPN8/RPN11|nr:M67 family metallopeptidase [Tannerella sp.]